MKPDEAGRHARAHIEVPWHEVRAARVQRRVLAELAAGTKPRRAVRTWLVAAACLAVLAAIVWQAPWPRTPARIHFADGSFVEPAGGARVAPVHVSEDRIEVAQLEGTASYEVVSRPGRAFVVRAGDVTIEVLGTAFRVERRARTVAIQVQRGRVQVGRGPSRLALGAGEQLTLEEGETAAPAGQGPASADTGASTGGSEVDAGPAPAASTRASEPAAREAPSAPRPDLAGPSAAELFRQADEARAAGSPERALGLLRELVQRHPRDGRVTMALFTIGRLEAQRGRHADAARAFESCGAAMNGEALAEAALARTAAGQAGQARALADRYLARFPRGPRAAEMARIAGR